MTKVTEINYGSFKQKVDEKGRWLINFSAALAAMRRGEKVARAHWGGYWFIPKHVHVEDDKPGEWKNFHSMNPMIVAKLKDDGGYAQATPYQEDLLAEDWVVIGREEEVPTPDKEDYKEAAEQSVFFGKGITAGTIEGGQIIGISTPDETAAVLSKRIEELRKIVEVQGEHGNWNYNDYMHGMHNGLVLALATMENCEPAFKDAPSEWLEDRHAKEPVGHLLKIDENAMDAPAPPEELWQLLDVLRSLDPQYDGAMRDCIKEKIAKALNL